MASRTSEQHGQLLKELNEERVAALTRISRTLESLIARLQVEHDPGKHAELREQAQKYRWYLEVQREALGIRHHRMVDELYRIPGPLGPELSRP
jgi:hypothetical protein